MTVEVSWISVLVLGVGIVVGFGTAYVRRGPKAMLPVVWSLLDAVLREVDVTLEQVDDEFIRRIVREGYPILLEQYPLFAYLPQKLVEDMVVKEWNRTRELYLLHREAMTQVEVRLVSHYSGNGRVV